jgi:capsular exopolysaccharide synthesis family protein
MSHPKRSAHESSVAHQLDVRGFFQALRERVWLVTACLLAGLGAAGYYLQRTPKTYAAKVVLEVQGPKQWINIQDVTKQDAETQEALKTIEQTLKNRDVLAQVVITNRLASDPRFTGGRADASPTLEQMVNRLSAMVDVRLRKGTRLIDITVQHPAAELTARVANSLVEEYRRQQIELSATESVLVHRILMQEAEALRHKLSAAEQALQDYLKDLASVSLEDRQTLVLQKLKDLSQRTTEAKAQRLEKEAAYQRLARCSNEVASLLAIPAVAADPTVMTLRAEVTKAETELATLRQEFKPKHPKYLLAESQLREATKALHRAVLNVTETSRVAFESAQATEAALEKAVSDQQALALELKQQEGRYNILKREVDSSTALYQNVLNRIKETELTKNLKQDRVHVVQRATVPEKPARPQPPQVLALGLLAGLGLGVLLALFLNAMDWSLNSVDQTEEYLGLPVLSTVPRVRGGVGRIRLIQSDTARSPEAEAFRTLRTAITMLGPKDERRTFLFTSAQPAEGKTFCAINFAASLAQQGCKTLLIDCDLRRPMVEKTLRGNPQRGCGVTDFLIGEKSLLELIQDTRQSNLFFVPAGTDAPHPAELLARTGIAGLLEEALMLFDRVVVDSAPLQAVSDTLLIAGHVHSVCLVVRAHKTPRQAARRAGQQLRQAGAPIAGAILNRLVRNRSADYYYYDSYPSRAYRDHARKPDPPVKAAA